MDLKVEDASLEVVSDVLSEAVDELTGDSKRKWAVMLVAFVFGSIATVLVIRYRRRRATEAVDSDVAATALRESDTDAPDGQCRRTLREVSSWLARSSALVETTPTLRSRRETSCAGDGRLVL